MRTLPSKYESLSNEEIISVAKQQARGLRREAVSAFWTSINLTGVHISRSSSRFLTRICRHRKMREVAFIQKEG